MEFLNQLKKFWIWIVLVIFLSSLISFGISFLLMGVIVSSILLVILINHNRIYKNGIETNGYLKNYEKDKSGDIDIIYEFKIPSGELISGKAISLTSFSVSGIELMDNKNNNPLDEIEIIYDAENPQNFIIKKLYRKTISAFILLLVFFSTFAVLGFLKIIGILG
jgi:hypothetical protein